MLMVAGMFGMFFLGALYLQRVLGYDAIEVGLAFLPVALGIAALSLGFSARLIMRFGAKPTLVAGLGAGRRGADPVPRHPGARQLRRGSAAVDGAARRRRRSGVPVADDARDVVAPRRRTRASPPAWSTPPSRSAARSGWRCSRRCRAPASNSLLASGDSLASSLTSGYHLAFTIGAVLIVVATALAVFVLPSANAAGAQEVPEADVEDHRLPALAEAEYVEEAA